MFLPTHLTTRRGFLGRSALGAGSLLVAPLLLESCTDHLITPPSTPITVPPVAEISISWYDQAKSFIINGLGQKPVEGGFLGDLVNTFQSSVWDQVIAQMEDVVGQKIQDGDETYTYAKGKLDALKVLIGEYLTELKYGTPYQKKIKWEIVTAHFTQDQSFFTAPGYETLLLPLFTQFATMYLSLLRDGVAFGQSWGREDYLHQKDITDLQAYFHGAVTHVTGWYNNGHTNVVNRTARNDQLCEPFRSINRYDRQMTLLALDFMDTWPYFDVTQYPNGMKPILTREIYSDPYGSCADSGPIVLPSPPTQLPTQLRVYGGLQIDAVQLTYPAGSGPGGLTQTPRMGDQSGGADYAPGGAVLTLSPDKPITQFRVVSIAASGHNGPFLVALQFQVYEETTPTKLLGGLNLPSGFETDPSYTDSGLVGYGPYKALSSIFINGTNNRFGTAGSVVVGFKHWQPPK